MLAKYYFEIKYVKESDNVKANAFSRKAELQRNNKMLGALLKQDKDEKI